MDYHHHHYVHQSNQDIFYIVFIKFICSFHLHKNEELSNHGHIQMLRCIIMNLFYEGHILL